MTTKTFRSKVDDIVLNADSTFGDVYLATSSTTDRRYFLAHRIVLVAASDVFASLLSINCNHCEEVSDENVVLIFDQIPGNILRNFLSLIYTGASSSLQTRTEQNALKELCLQLQLKSVVSQSPSTDSNRATINFGFKEVEPPSHYVTSSDKFMDTPVRDITADDDFAFKREPEDFEVDAEVDNSYFEEPVEVNISANTRSTRSTQQKKKLQCQGCSKEFKFKMSLVNHLKHCYEANKTVDEEDSSMFDDDNTYEPETNLEEVDIKTELVTFQCNFCQREFESNRALRTHMRSKHTNEADSFSKRRHFTPNKVHVPKRVENGRLYCMDPECESKNVSFQWIGGLREHFFEKHATDDQKPFTCHICGEKFGTNGLKNKHCKRTHRNVKSSKKRLQSDSESDEDEDEKDEDETSNQDSNSKTDRLDIPSEKRNGLHYCLSGDCVTEERSFNWFRQLRDHYFENHASDDQKQYSCEQCGDVFGTNALRIRHQKKVHTENTTNTHTCTTCSEEFDSSVSLKNHMMEQHDDKSEEIEIQNDRIKPPQVDIPFEEKNGLHYCLSGDCPTTGRSFSWFSGLRAHFFEKHVTDDLKHFPCKICGALFGTLGVRNRHYRDAHGKSMEKHFSCSECSRKFHLRSSLRKHMLLQHEGVELGPEFRTKRSVPIKGPKVDVPLKEEDGRFFCLSGDCESKNQSFQWLSGLREHFFEKHATEDQKLFTCQLCNKKFGTNGLRNKHHKLCHPGKPFKMETPLEMEKCEICNETFLNVTRLTKHLKTEHQSERPYFCKECGKTYKFSKNLRDHMQTHADVSTTCEICGQTFKGEQLFKKHYKLRHVERFSCTVCEKKFGLRHALTAHMRYHTGEKPYVCEQCGASYEVSQSLHAHISRRHKPLPTEKNFPCETCGKMFYTAYSRNKHAKYVHADGRQFVCVECGNTYKGSGQLRKHLEIHKGITYHCEHCTEKFSCPSYYKKHLRKRHPNLFASNKQT